MTGRLTPKPWVVGLALLLVLGLIWALVLAPMWQSHRVMTRLQAPGGKFWLHEVHSLDDGVGHAPYGVHLLLSTRAQVHRLDEGEVVFAGYCQRPLAYSWRTDRQIVIHCRGAEGPPITLARRVRGVDVELKGGQAFGP